VICGSCGTTNAAGRKFCLECGTRLATGCPTCGASNEPGAKFCGQCGNTLESVAPPVSVALPAGGEPAAGSAPTTERRFVSVLFADLVGFTARAEGRDPEETRELLSRYFDASREIVERYGGTVEKFIGDAVMAIWGAPVAQEDDAERSVRAALDLVAAVRRLETGLEARAGIMTGEAAVNIGAIGQGMVAGDLVNTASRLQAAAAPGVVLVGEVTRRTAEAAIAFEAVGDQTLKGKAAPVPAWRALRVVAERGGAGRTERLEAPFVGRDEELHLLQDLYHATVKERRARLVSVTGQAGIGKSRLAWEFLKYIDGLVEDVRWHQGRSPAYGEGVTFWALGEMVRRRAGLAEGDDETTSRAGIVATIAEYVADESDRRWIEPALLALLGIGEPPAGGRTELFAAWRTFFEGVARSAPTVLVFEDLHWADSGLLDFIDYLLDWSREYPILVIALARPELLERRPGFGAGRRNFVGMSLEPLDEPAMRALLGGLVPGLPEPAVRAILARADGVPLYAVETVRMLVAEGRLEQVGDSYRPAGDLTTLAVPEGLQALIAARLDVLEAADRAILQDGAVLGQAFSVPALAALTGLASESLEPRLRDLVRRDLLRLDTDPRSPERGHYGFTQGLVREVAYGTLAKRERRARHLAAARYIEAQGEDELAGILAAHYLAAHRESPEGPERDALAIQARLALSGAAERAAGLGGHEQALAYLDRALEVAQDATEEAALRERAGAAAAAAGRFDDAEGHFTRAIQLHEGSGDRAAFLRASAALGQALLTAFRIEQGLHLLEETVARSTDLAATSDGIALASALARAHFMHGDYRSAIALSDQVLDAAERANLVEIIGDTLITRANALVALGRLREGWIVQQGAFELAEAHGISRIALRALISLGASQATSDPRAGLATGRLGLPRARRLGLRTVERYLLGNAVEAAIRVGEWQWAVDGLETLLPEVTDASDRGDLHNELASVLGLRGEPTADLLAQRPQHFNDPQARSGFGLTDARVALGEGRLEAAYEAAMAAADLQTEYGYAAVAVAVHAAAWLRDVDRAEAVRAHMAGWYAPALEVDGLTLEAGIAALEGRHGAAIAGYEVALGRWRGLGAEFDLALCVMDMATLLGPEAVAASAADEARAILERVGATPLLQRLDAALGRPHAAAEPQAPAAADTQGAAAEGATA
jgi:class 3 adenylate cyclase/tetratricopeptide (TPR) repeat protein